MASGAAQMALRAEKWHLMASGSALMALRVKKWHLMALGGAQVAVRANKWHLDGTWRRPDGIEGQEMTSEETHMPPGGT